MLRTRAWRAWLVGDVVRAEVPSHRVADVLAVPSTTITLTGHAPTGQPDAHGLAQTRAELVRELFVAQGGRPTQIGTVVSLGVAPESSDPARRRVDVLIR